MNYNLINSEKEIDLLKKIGEFPAVVAEAAKNVCHTALQTISYELAAAFHSFYNAEKVLDQDNLELTKARLH